MPEPPPAPVAQTVVAAAPAEGLVAEGATAEGAVAEGAVAEGATAEGLAAASDAATADTVHGEQPVDGAAVSPDAVGVAELGAEPAVAETYGHAIAESALGVDASESTSPAQAPGDESGALEAAAGEAGESDHHEEHAEEAHADDVEAEPEPEAPPPPALGTIFRGRIGSVAESGHVVLVNRIVDVGAAKQRIIKAREQRQRVRGVVYGFNRGGFDVMVEGVRVFCPASGMALGPVDNPEPLLGQRLEFTVPPAKAGTHGLVVSRRGILERQQRKAAKQLFRSLQPGQRLKGRVTQVREFGLFVDLGGFEGLVHSSELSFARGVRPQDVAQPGDEIDVQVLRVGEGQTRKERERVSLSMKTLQADPWSEQGALLEPGNIVTGKVVRTTEFGAFIELVPTIEGLLHISELGRELKHASQALEEGQEIKVVVERVDRKARRISLSKLTQAEEKALAEGVDPKSGRPPKPGQHLTVIVEKVEHAGLLVQVPGVFGRRGRGFIPNSEMGTERGTDHRRGFPPGTHVPAKVVGVDRDGGFRFSRKAVAFEEEKRAVQDYRREAARHGLGTFGDILRAKLEGSKPNS
jgi:small subunit ribosomal protein S1